MLFIYLKICDIDMKLTYLKDCDACFVETMNNYNISLI